MDAPKNGHQDNLQRLVAMDPELVRIAALAGPLPERPGTPGFAGLASVIVSQLVSRRSAEAIWDRLSAATGPVTPENFLKVGRGTGPRLGLTAAKADTLVRLSEAILSEPLDLESLAVIDAAEAVARLTAIKGIGLWTAEVHLLFNCDHPDIFPAGDLALRAAYASAFNAAERPQQAALRQASHRWSPFRSTAARLFWAYYAHMARTPVEVLPQLS